MNKAQEVVDNLAEHWCRQVADLEDNTGAVDNTEAVLLAVDDTEAVLLAVDNTDTAEDTAVASVQSDTGGQGWTGGGGWTLDRQLKL